MDVLFDNFVKDQNRYRNDYKNIKFFISFSIKKLKKVLSNKDSIIIQLNTCECDKENIDYLCVKRKDSYIRIKDVIEELNKEGFCPNCNHIYLKDIKKSNKGHEVFKLDFW